MKGVILCGGKGTRLDPLTRVTNKHLLPVGNYPMVFHPICQMIDCDIRDIMIVTGREHCGDFAELLGNGSMFDCALTYRVQEEAGGIAEALSLAENFVGNNDVMVLLGDNIFTSSLKNFAHVFKHRAEVFNENTWDINALLVLKKVLDPHRFGVVELKDFKIIGMEEKPEDPKSNLIQTGCYFYDETVFDVIKKLEPSARGELEILDVNKKYMQMNTVAWQEISKDWTDAGTMSTYAQANTWMENVQYDKLRGR